MEKMFQLLFACHRLPERSFFYKGVQFPICARCTGILLGYILGIGYWIIFSAIPLWMALILLVPLVIDGGIQFIGLFQSTNIRRLITGILAGIGTVFTLYGILSLGFKHGKLLYRFLFN